MLFGKTRSIIRNILLSILLCVSITSAEVNIDQAWLNSQDPTGQGPYYLDQANTTYKLQTNVITPGTAFAIINQGIIFDLNGMTITYNNAPKIPIPNGSFEQGSGSTATGWDFSQAPNASRFQGNFLWNEVYDGEYSLKFTTPAPDQEIRSLGTITLEPNTTYSFTGMFEYGGKGETKNPGVKLYARLEGTGLPTREVFWSGTNYRGIQLVDGFESLTPNVFKTGSTPETYHVTVGINGAGSVPASAGYIDDIKIQRHKTYGVAIGAQSWGSIQYPGVNRYGSGGNAIVKNGTITQGQDGATWAHPIFFRSTGNVQIESLTMTFHGANTHGIYHQDSSTVTAGSKVLGNTFYSNVKTISNRDNFYGAVIKNVRGEICDNIILGGPHGGIIGASGIGTSLRVKVCNNHIKLRSKYTNGFAIISGRGADVYENVIECHEGEWGCRGMGGSGSDDESVSTKLFDNIVKVQYHIDNQEYQGASLGGAYGVQLENSKNLEFYNNEVYAYGNAVPAYALRINSTDGGSAQGLNIHDNLLVAISNGSHAGAIKLSDVTASNIQVRKNTIVTNDGFIQGTSGSIVSFYETTLMASNVISDPYPFESDYWPNNNFHTEISFVDNDYTDQATRDYFSNATWRNSHRYGGAVDNRVAHQALWTTTFKVKDSNGNLLSNATVNVRNSQDQLVFTGSTDTNGELLGQIKEFRTQGSTKTDYNNHIATASYNGKEVSAEFVANDPKTVWLIFASDISEHSPSPSPTPSPLPSVSPSTSPTTSPSSSPSPSASPSSSPNGGDGQQSSEVSISINTVSKLEGTQPRGKWTKFKFKVSLSKIAEVPVYVNYKTKSGTALSGKDFRRKSGLIFIPAGKSSKIITVKVNPDQLIEANEFFYVKLSNPLNAVLGQDDTGTGEIVNDD